MPTRSSTVSIERSLRLQGSYARASFRRGVLRGSILEPQRYAEAEAHERGCGGWRGRGLGSGLGSGLVGPLPAATRGHGHEEGHTNASDALLERRDRGAQKRRLVVLPQLHLGEGEGER